MSKESWSELSVRLSNERLSALGELLRLKRRFMRNDDRSIWAIIGFEERGAVNA